MIEYISSIPLVIKVIIILLFVHFILLSLYVLSLRIGIYFKKRKSKKFIIFNDGSDELIENKNILKALKILESNLQENKAYYRNHEYLGYCHYYLGNFNKAINHFYNYYNNYKNKFILRYISLSHYELENNFEEAVKILTPLKYRFMTKGDYFACLFWLHYKIGEKKRAIKYFRKFKRIYYENMIDWILTSDMSYHSGKLFMEIEEYEKSNSAFLMSIKNGGEQNYFTKKSEEEIKKLQLENKLISFEAEDLKKEYKAKYLGKK